MAIPKTFLYVILVTAATYRLSVAEGWQSSGAGNGRRGWTNNGSTNDRQAWHQSARYSPSARPFWARGAAKSPQTLLHRAVSSSQLLVETLSRPKKNSAAPVPPKLHVEFDVIDGDLVLPSKRPLLPPLEEIITGPSVMAIEDDVKPKVAIRQLDAALFAAYFCNSVALSLPVVLMPLVAAEQAATSGPGFAAAAFVATMASISTIGGGLGKFVNGFLCSAMGGRRSSSLYLTGMAALSFLLSLVPVGPHMGLILAGVEFFSSIQWAACSLLLANHYEHDPGRFAQGITILSLASTSGTLLAKIGGTALLRFVPSWRTVAQCGAAISLMGSFLIRFFVSEMPTRRGPRNNVVERHAVASKKLHIRDIVSTIRSILGSRLFWQVGLAHATAYLARTSDRVLGPFFHEVTSLPRQLCGGFTAVITIGFIHGLAKGNVYHQLPDIESKSTMLRRSYMWSVVSAIGLAACACKWVNSLIPSKALLACTVALLSGAMASSLSFQFYQIPTLFSSKHFGHDKTVCLSFLDGLGLLLAAPVWATTSKIVGSLGEHGWLSAWLMLASLFGAGGLLMMNVFPHALHTEREAKTMET